MPSLSPQQQQALKQLVTDSFVRPRTTKQGVAGHAADASTTAADPLLQDLDCYVVGGAVRDALLGLPAGDKDWVVVGSSPEIMAAKGFIPVGGDFPVFLHPHTKEEFALARTERKSGRGYKGFTFYTGTDVSLADDLKRRDLTINAMAIDRQGQLHDPLQAYKDLQQKVLRHIGNAFIEDPVRLLRLARFAARFTQFRVADTTMHLAEQLVHNGEVDALVPERVWQELHRGLASADPVRMFDVLHQCGALKRIMPHLVYSAAVRQLLQAALIHPLTTKQRFALLCVQSPHVAQLAQQLKAPAAYQDLAQLVPWFIHQLDTVHTAQAMAACLQRVDVLRRPERFTELLQVVQQVVEVDEAQWQRAAQSYRSVDAGAIAAQYAQQPQHIPAAIQQARVAAVSASF